MKNAEDQLRLVNEQLKELEAETKALRDEDQTIRKNIEAYRSEWNGLQDRLIKAQEFLMLEKQIEENVTELEHLKTNRQQVIREMTVLKRQMNRYDEDIDVLEENKNSNNIGLK